MKAFSSHEVPPEYPFCFLVDPRGYLLAEVMIAIAIFSIGFAAVGSLILTTTGNNSNANILTQATLLAHAGKLDAANSSLQQVLAREPGNERATQIAQQLSRALAASGATP